MKREYILGVDDVEAKGAENGELAARLNKLFEVMRKPNTPPLSNAAAAAAITEKTGVSISPAYLWQLRNGSQNQPYGRAPAGDRGIFRFAGVLSH